MLNLSTRIRQNWKSGLTVSLVSMPLSISLAVASGSTPTVGIITAIWAGLIASLFGGSNFNIVGPTGALSGLIATYVISHGTSYLPLLTIITGCFILVAYLMKLERYLIFIPSSVIHGFTLGVAFIIGFNQLNSALGLTGIAKKSSLFWNIIESFRHIQQTSFIALGIFIIFLAALFVLRRLIPKIPGALLLSILGIVIGWLQTKSATNLGLTTLGDAFKNIHFQFFEPLHITFSISILGTGATIGLITILETMLSAKIADGLTHTKHNERKEMLGLGLANIASGIMGGIPATAALARTSFNINAGANDKMSATFNAIFLMIISFVFLTWFKYIPMPVIAAILVYVAINMIEAEHFIKFYKYQKSGFWISILVAAITFYKDPTIGILFGTVVALLLFVEKNSHGQFNIKLNTFQDGLIKNISGEKLSSEIENEADILVYSFEGKLAYINSRAHIKRFEDNLIKYKIVILRFRGVHFIDLDGAEAIEEIISIVRKRGQKVCLTGISENTMGLLMQVSPEFKKLKEEGLVFAKSEEALKHFGAKIKD